MERAEQRDPALTQDLHELLVNNERDYGYGQAFTNPNEFKYLAEEETRPFREYMLTESIQQYKDYYQSDDEEQSFFEYLDNLSNRDRIRMMENFKDYTVINENKKDFITIPKREYNPQLSLFGNMVQDLVDFRDRVQPESQNIALLEQARNFQKVTPEKFRKDVIEEFKQLLEN